MYTPLRNPLLRGLHGVYNPIEVIFSWTEQKLRSILKWFLSSFLLFPNLCYWYKIIWYQFIQHVGHQCFTRDNSMCMFCRLLFVPLYFFVFGHCVVCSSSIYGFWLPFCYLQTLLPTKKSHSVFHTLTSMIHKLFKVY